MTIGAFGEAARLHKGARVLLGVRPEAITPDPGDAAAGTTFDALVDVIEPTGADNLAFLTLGGAEVIARLPPNTSVAGQNIKLKIDPARAMLFDPNTEQLIG